MTECAQRIQLASYSYSSIILYNYVYSIYVLMEGRQLLHCYCCILIYIHTRCLTFPELAITNYNIAVLVMVCCPITLSLYTCMSSDSIPLIPGTLNTEPWSFQCMSPCQHKLKLYSQHMYNDQLSILIFFIMASCDK